jgi:WD40 repeat protein
MAVDRRKKKVKNEKAANGNNKLQEIDRHEKGKYFEQKVGVIFTLMGFKVEYNRFFSGYEIDVFIKKKRNFGEKYEYYIIECKDWGKKVGQEVVNKVFTVREAVKNDSGCRALSNDCEAMIISAKGFTDSAIKAASAHGIILYTYDGLQNRLMNFEYYLSTLIRTFESSSLNDLYIVPDFTPEHKSEKISGFQFIKEWLRDPQRKRLSLLGNNGTGKTSFAKVLAYNMAKAYKKDPGKSRIPFLIDLRECKRAFSFKSLLHDQLKINEVKEADEEIFLKLLCGGHILLIFDAFDEMVDLSRGADMLINFEELNQVVKDDAKVILTSRTHYFKDKAEAERILKKHGTRIISSTAARVYREISRKSEYEIVYLKEFSDSQIREYLQLTLGDEWETAFSKIKSTHNLYDLCFRPVLLDLIVKTLPNIGKGEWKLNESELYEIYTQFWFDREVHRLQILKEEKVELMEELSYTLWKEGKPCIHYSTLLDAVCRHLKRESITVRDLEALNYEMRTASFLVRDEDGYYSFAHESFKEFFIARKIQKELSNDNFRVLDSTLFSKEIVFFLLHLEKDGTRIIPNVAGLLKTEFHDRISDNAFFVFYTVQKMVFLGLQFSFRKDTEFSTQEVEEFKKMVQSHLTINLDIKGISLSEWTMPYIVCNQSVFNEESIEGSIFFRKFFEDGIFNKTNMKGSDFSGSIFKKVCFDQVEAHHCNFKNCSFDHCTIKNSDFSMSNFKGAKFDSCTIERNVFIGVGFYRSNFDIEIHKNNFYLGEGALEIETTNLFPILVDQGHEDIVRTVVSSRDGRFMVSGSDDKTVKLWDFETGHLINTMKGHDRAVLSVSISPDNRRIVSGSSDGEVKLWDLESGSLIATLKKHKDRVNSVFISPVTQRILSGSSDRTVKLWDLESGHLIKTMEGHKRAVLLVFVCPDNQRFISVSSDYTVKFWNLENGHLIKTFEDHNHSVSSVTVSQDNRWIVSSGYDKRIKLWKLGSGVSPEKTLEGHKELVKTVFISLDNQWLISGSDDKTVKLWDLKSGDLVSTFKGHDNIINSVFIRRDNRLIVSGSCDKTIKVWDLESGRLIRTLGDQKDSFDSNITNPQNFQRLYYRDRLALYPARDFPKLRLKDLENNARGRHES